ncbi:Integral membrane protein [Streptomyces venezuelae]|uniref:M56 family metallopeptidase n=1 Tax=Streptomyces gardneri TaxID=66892 RepID=UPI0006BC3A2B|nr:M56 family metallopeptidase [Streptomyces gardneri]ALO11782.1 Integral membrane protein [Streptomyces venezuelae]QPK48646.1 M56 family metallopeptidase [Streptomyces gardneri]WRK40121.1 M56 family metallopeptidase [Streptomyces venezuelae]CUM37662.1 Peptidase M48, Ste24p precursor [Streptomyces venezuelae]
MGFFVFLPLVLPLTAWPVARLAESRLHPRTATRLLSAVAGVLAVCSTLCLGLLMIVGTAQLPGNPLPDAWSDPEVRAALPYDEVAGRAAIPALLAVLVSCGAAARRQVRARRRAEDALAGLPETSVTVLPDGAPYAYALPGRRRGRVVVSTGMLAALTSRERRALFAHERAHLAGRHHRHLLTVHLAARANPFLRPLRTAVAYTAERWADEEAAAAVGSRRCVARAIGTAALLAPPTTTPLLPAVTGPGPVPRRVAALLRPAPTARTWPSLFTAVGLAAWVAAFGATASALSSANSAVALFLALRAATPM